MLIEHQTTPRLESLREEVRTWLEEHLPPEYEGFQWDFDEDPRRWAFYREFWRKQGAKGWLEPGWPVEYGGLALSRRSCAVIREEFARRRAGALAGIGMMVGPAILRLGTAQQKRDLLPAMAAGEIMWAEGYSEPDAGSDLASLRTRAELVGGEWVINGTKTFCTAGHHCNWIIIAARTDPDPSKRHRGITYFLSPMDVPGIELRPLYNLGGGRQNIVLIDNLHVPSSGLLGTLNEGWTQIWFGLGGDALPQFPEDDLSAGEPYEPPLSGQGWALDQLVRYCRDTLRGGEPMITDPVVRLQLAELAIGVEIDKVLGLEERCGYGPHLHQAVGKEFQPRFAQVAMEILGPLGQVQAGPLAPLGGEIDRLYRRSFGNHAGGTSQLKRMVVATRALGLPR